MIKPFVLHKYTLIHKKKLFFFEQNSCRTNQNRNNKHKNTDISTFASLLLLLLFLFFSILVLSLVFFWFVLLQIVIDSIKYPLTHIFRYFFCFISFHFDSSRSLSGLKPMNQFKSIKCMLYVLFSCFFFCKFFCFYFSIPIASVKNTKTEQKIEKKEFHKN